MHCMPSTVGNMLQHEYTTTYTHPCIHPIPHPHSPPQRVAERLNDPSPTVRTTLKSLITTALLPAHTPNQLAPFLPLLLVHLRAALTSPTTAICMDALEVLEALAGKLPEQLLAHHVTEVLGMYVDVLQGVESAHGAELHVHKGHVKVCVCDCGGCCLRVCM